MGSHRFGSKLSLAAAALALLIGAASSMAQTPAYTITTTTTGDSLGNPPFTLGSQFTVNQNLTVTALGIFDNNQDGLVDSYPIGLFDSSGNLLASTTIADGTTDPLIDQFRYASISSVALTAGSTYEIGALYTSSDDGVIFPGDASGFATNSAITFDASTFGGGGSLSAPLGAFDGDPGFFGPNMLISTASTPLPSSLWGGMALLSLLAGGTIVRRKAAIC